MKKYYYLPFIPEAKINYYYLLALYDLAEYNTESKVYDTINYISVNKLAASLNISASTVNRIFDNEEYKKYLRVDRQNKTITLFNKFIKGEKAQFVRLTADEVKLLREYNDNLLVKYLIYLKYYCGYTKDNKTDFTAKQFLSACGYSTKSNDTISTISNYNNLLVSNGFISISKYTDELGHTRNTYRYN